MKLPHHRKYQHGIFKHFPLLIPKQCACCKYDIVRESMWRFETGPWMNGVVGRPHYLCKGCAPRKQRAHDYAIQYTEQRSKRQPAPPPNEP